VRRPIDEIAYFVLIADVASVSARFRPSWGSGCMDALNRKITPVARRPPQSLGRRISNEREHALISEENNLRVSWLLPPTPALKDFC